MSSKKINHKRKSILDDIDNDNQIIITPSIDDAMQQIVIQKIQKQNDKNSSPIDVSFNDLIEDIKEKKQNNEEILDEEIIEKTEELIDEGKIETSDELGPLDVVEAIEEVAEAIDNIPDLEPENIEDIVIEPSKKVGWIKTKITINSKIFKKELSLLASICAKKSDGVIRHRKCDVRLIANTNKIHLRNSDLKLLSESYTIKPVGGVVNKSTRIMLSVDEKDKNHLIVYMQRGRDKFIHKFDISDESDFIWLGDWIVNFYEFENFKLSLHQLISKSYGESELFNVLKRIAKTKKYKIRMPKNIGNELVYFSFTPIFGDKTYVRFHIQLNKTESFKTGQKLYNVFVTNDINNPRNPHLIAHSGKNFFFTINDLLSPEALEGFEKLIENYHSQIDPVEVNIDELAFQKLKHRKLKDAVVELVNWENAEEIGLEITKILSNHDIKVKLIEKGEHIKKDYDAEGIIFKTNYINFAILQYQAILVEGGDKRHGKDYITTEEYYQKYKVKDRRDYELRRNTVLSRQNIDRNYHTRRYMFKLFYTVNDKKQTPIVGKTFIEVIEKSKILTDKPVTK